MKTHRAFSTAIITIAVVAIALLAYGLFSRAQLAGPAIVVAIVLVVGAAIAMRVAAFRWSREIKGRD
jgi:uncharacterized membrane protein